MVYVGEFDSAGERWQRNISQAKVSQRLVGVRLRRVSFDQAVLDVTVIVDNEDVLYSASFLINKRLTQIVTHLVQIFLAVDAVNSQRHSRHYCLLLLHQHVGVSFDRLQVYVVLNPERQTEEHDQQEYQAGAKAIEDLQCLHWSFMEDNTGIVVSIRPFLY